MRAEVEQLAQQREMERQNYCTADRRTRTLHPFPPHNQTLTAVDISGTSQYVELVRPILEMRTSKTTAYNDEGSEVLLTILTQWRRGFLGRQAMACWSGSSAIKLPSRC